MQIINRTVRSLVSGAVVRQKTLKRDVRCEGVSLHGGQAVRLRMRAAAPDTGIVFRRTDVDRSIAEVRANFNNVVDSRLCTTIANEHGTSVATIEHLMAALAGCEIDNALIELDGGEVPVMDGSAAPFVGLIEHAGIVEQGLPRRAIRILRPVTVRDGAKILSVEPSDVPAISLEIDFDAARIGRQAVTVPLTGQAFRTGIADARTFGFLHEVEAMRQMGLARGGSLENAVVISGDEVLNEEGLRHSDEFVRHKVLDCIGDLYLAGAPILGLVSGSRTGHALNNRLLHALFEDESAWTWVTIEDEEPVADVGWRGESAFVPA